MFLAGYVITLCTALTITSAYRVNPINSRRLFSNSFKKQLIFTQSLISTCILIPGAVHAVQGTVKATPLEDTKAAIKKLKAALDGIAPMTDFANKDEFSKVAEILSRNEYSDFENIATLIVRSDALTQDEKVALGTIKRYGLVADALIMLGGAKGELRQGGLKIGDEPASIDGEDEEEDDQDDDDDDKKQVNKKELLRYLKLSRDSLSDIYKIVEPILQR